MSRVLRLKSKFWVQAYVRARNAAGAFATVVHRGDEDFGVIWVRLNRLDGTSEIFAPAPEPLGGDPDERPERRFVLQHKGPSISDAEADELIRRQRTFDSDFWLVEVEDRSGAHGLDLSP